MVWFRSFILNIKFRHAFHRDFSSAGIQEKQVKIAKWNVNYIKVGSGPHHVFCLPGALGTIWTDFKPQIEGFDRKLFTLIVWDPPGYGKSRPPNREFTPDFHYRDSEYMLQFMKALSIPKYSLVGWSDGGMAAIIHAAKYPDAVEKLVVTATASRMLPKNWENLENLKDINSWSEKARKPMAEVYGDQLPGLWLAWTECYLSLNGEDGNVCGDLLKDIKCPTLVLHGAKDNVAPVECSVETMKGIAGSRYHVYPGGKHNLHLRYAEDFNKRVQDFLLE